MGLFRHPCLVRGIVHTPHGAFSVVRGLVEMPDDIGEALGWSRSGSEEGTSGPAPQEWRARRGTHETIGDRVIAGR